MFAKNYIIPDFQKKIKEICKSKISTLSSPKK